jgi:SAM-dependent methyltransferase
MRDGDKGAGTTGPVWTGATGRIWAEAQDLMDRLNAPVSQALEAQVLSGPHGTVLDVGCGGGGTTLDMARRLGPDGLCVGIDISPELIALAERRAAEAGVTQARFVLGDAQSHPLGAEAYDAVMSRFGVMFFDDPVAAFANLRRAARPDGALTFVCWRSPQDNPFALIPFEAALPHIPDLAFPAPHEPGRFAFADRDRVRGILSDSGWRKIVLAPLDAPTPVSFDELMMLSLKLGFLGPVLKTQTEAVQARVHEAVAERLAPHVVDGVIPLTAACWLVTARR